MKPSLVALGALGCIAGVVAIAASVAVPPAAPPTPPGPVHGPAPQKPVPPAPTAVTLPALGVAPTVAAAVPTAPAKRAFAVQVLAFSPWGSGPGELGHRLPAEGNPEGPMSLAADDRGNLYVLDQVNRRVVVFDERGSITRTIPTGTDTVQDLAVHDLGVVLLDRLAEKVVRFVGLDGTERGRVALEGQGVSEGGGVTGVFVTPDGTWVEVEHRTLVRVATPAGLPDAKRPTIDGRPTAAGLLRAARDPSGGALVTAAPSKGGAPGLLVRVSFSEPVLTLLSLDADREGRVYVGAHLLREGAAPLHDILAERITVVSLSPSGTELARLDLPPPDGPEETKRTLAVAPNGDVFHLHVGTTGVTIRRAR